MGLRNHQDDLEIRHGMAQFLNRVVRQADILIAQLAFEQTFFLGLKQGHIPFCRWRDAQEKTQQPAYVPLFVHHFLFVQFAQGEDARHVERRMIDQQVVERREPDVGGFLQHKLQRVASGLRCANDQELGESWGWFGHMVYGGLTWLHGG